MNGNRILHGVVAMVGIGALMAYLVACRPSWSPDGSKVLFPYFNPETQVPGIALFDRETGTTKSVFVDPSWNKSGQDLVIPSAQWDRRGKRAIVVWADGDNRPEGLHVRVVAVDGESPAREHVLELGELQPGAPLGMPLPESDGCLFAAGKSYLARLDLETGRIERRQLEHGRQVILVGRENEVYYLGVLPHSLEIELGALDRKTLARKPGARLPMQEVSEISPYFAVGKDGSVFVLAGKKEGKYHLFLVSGEGLEKSIPLELSPGDCQLGNLEWSPDGKTVYAALFGKQERQEASEVGIAEIAVDTGSIRVTPILKLKERTEVDLLRYYFQIALSPDGKTIAASSTYLFDALEKWEDCGLYLVDLTSPERKVTKIAPPIPGKKE